MNASIIPAVTIAVFIIEIISAVIFIKISECEEMIMKVIWDEEGDPDLDTVTNKVALRFGRKWKKQTVATFMTRLMKKGWIDIYKLGRYSHYHPLITIEQYRKDKMVEFFDLYPHTEKDKLFQMITQLMLSLAE